MNFKQWLFDYDPMRCIMFHHRIQQRIKSKLLRALYIRWVYSPVRNKYQIWLSYDCIVGKRLQCPHGNVIIGAKQIGDDVSIFQYSVLGQKRIGSEHRPIVGDRVTIATGCHIFGNAHIESGKFVKAGTVIVGDA